MNKLRHYLIGRHFIARVDHKPLIELLKNRMTSLTEGWMETILMFSFTTEYLPGKENVLADALNWCYEDDITIKSLEVSKEESDRRSLEWEAELKGLTIPQERDYKQLVEVQHALGHFGSRMIVSKLVKQGFWWPK